MTQNSCRTGKLYGSVRPSVTWVTCLRASARHLPPPTPVCCEDTRVTSKLLMPGHFKPLVRCDENVIASRAAGLVDRLLAGETLAFASDAGMPSVDPGQALVEAAREADVSVEVVPGPSACVTALVSSGIPCEHFFFEAFWVASLWRPRAPAFATPCRRPRRAHLLRVSTSHRRDARGRGRRSFPARCCRLPRTYQAARGGLVWIRRPARRGELRARGEVAARSRWSSRRRVRTRRAGIAGWRCRNGGPRRGPARGHPCRARGGPASAVAKRLSQKYSRRKRDVYAMVLDMQ